MRNSDDSQADPTERRVLVLPPTGADARAMDKLFSGSDISFLLCASIDKLCEALRVGAAVALLSEEALLARPEELLGWIANQPVWSDLPLIVLSRAGSESTALAPVIPKLGNVSVVERPVRTSTLISVVRSCLRARERQYLVREYLAQREIAQRKIQEGERRYRSVIENINDYAIFTTDLEGRVNSWNEGAAAMLGYPAGEILGRPVSLFCTEEDVGAAERELRQAETEGRVTSARWAVRKGGDRLFIDSVVVAVRDELQQRVGFAHFFRDVTAKHRIEMEREQLLDSERAARGEAERSSRTKDEFLATLSHELRTPLNAVLGWAQVLRRSPSVNGEVANGLAVIERNARAQAQIIEDLLDMSSIISGKVRLDVQRLELASVVEATVEAVKPAAQSKGIRLQVVLDPGAGPVRGDPSRLQQVLWNLLTNAVKFTHKDGRILVALSRINSHVEIEVTDNGEGIAPTFLPHVFDRFRQADASTTRRHGGLGLGLSIVKQLVELHGGTIVANSAGLGSGATFRISLPLMATADDPQDASPPREHPARSINPEPTSLVEMGELKGVRVLVVDDEPDARALIRRFLQDCHADVLTAASADEAMEMLVRESPDVLVSDIGMPGQDGYALIRRVRSLSDAHAHIPAVALTAYARVQDRVKAIQAGYQLHLSKPVEAIELVAMVESLAKGSIANEEA